MREEHTSAQPDDPPRRLIVAVLVLAAACVIPDRGSFATVLWSWPFVSLVSTSDGLQSVVAAQPRTSSSDTFMLGLACRAATSESGPAIIITPYGWDGLFDSNVYISNPEDPWIEPSFLEDLVTSDLQRVSYQAGIATSTVDAMLEEGTLEEFSDTVIAPPVGSVEASDTLVVFSTGRGMHMVVLTSAQAGMFRDSDK